MMRNKHKVWVSIVGDLRYIKSHGIDMRIPDLYDFPAYQKMLLSKQIDKEKAHRFIEYGCKISSKIRNFKKLDVLPDALYPENEDELPEDGEYIFTIMGGAMVVNESCANILKQFRLGNSTLTPLKIRDVLSDHIWENGTFYLFNLCELREYMLTPQSHHHFRCYTITPPPKYDVRLDLDHDILEISHSALDCDVDIWHDPTLRDSCFISDKLRQAFIHANMLDKWHMKSCQLL